jgi:hypothetical protein
MIGTYDLLLLSFKIQDANLPVAASECHFSRVHTELHICYKHTLKKVYITFFPYFIAYRVAFEENSCVSPAKKQLV